MLATGDFRGLMNAHGFNLSEGAKFIADVDDGKLRCLAAFDNYDGNDIEVHIVCDGMTRAWIRAVCEFVFETCGCRRMTSLNDASNFTMAPYLERLGFKYEGTKRNGLPNADLLIYGMTEEDCKWVRERQE